MVNSIIGLLGSHPTSLRTTFCARRSHQPTEGQQFSLAHRPTAPAYILQLHQKPLRPFPQDLPKSLHRESA